MSSNQDSLDEKSFAELVLDYSKDPYEQAILLTVLPQLYEDKVAKEMLRPDAQTDAIREWIKERAKKHKADYQKDMKQVIGKYKQELDELLKEATLESLKEDNNG